LFSNRNIGEFNKPDRIPASLEEYYLSPVYNALALTMHHNVIVLWDISIARKESGVSTRLSKEKMANLWADLGNPDPLVAYRAACSLSSCDRIVPFLKTRIDLIEIISSKEIPSLLNDLDNVRFPIRQRAQQKLIQAGDDALAIFRTTTRKCIPSPELRRRLQNVLAELEKPSLQPEALRFLWALEILEQLGTPEARELLKALGKRAPEAWLTLEAQASYVRLLRFASK
jgi:hypothetical protein